MDIHVEVTEAGLYPGAKGRVIEVKSEDEVKIIVFGLNEEMIFPIKHLRATKPKAEQRVKVIQVFWDSHTSHEFRVN